MVGGKKTRQISIKLLSFCNMLWMLQGMAMGAQANIVDSVHIFIAIAAHKGLAAYALGSSVVDSQVGHTRHSHYIAPQCDWNAACPMDKLCSPLSLPTCPIPSLPTPFLEHA